MMCIAFMGDCMIKKNFKKWMSIALAFVAIFSFLACDANLLDNNEYGIVRIRFSSASNARAIGENGLPEFEDSNVKILVFDDKGEKINEKVGLNVSFRLVIGSTVTVKAVITSLTAEWTGSKTFKVEKVAEKTIAISKKAKAFPALTYSLEENAAPAYNLTVNLGSKELVKESIESLDSPEIFVFQNTRDYNGNLYIVYGKSDTLTFKVFDCDGEEKKGFSYINKQLSADVFFESLTTDKKNGIVYAFIRSNAKITIYTYDPKGSALDFTTKSTISVSSEYLTKCAVYDGKIILMYYGNLDSSDEQYEIQAFVYSYDSTNSKWDKEVEGKEIKVGNTEEDSLDLKDLYVDEKADKINIYALLGANPLLGYGTHNLDDGSMSLGMIQCFAYDKSNGKIESGAGIGLEGSDPLKITPGLSGNGESTFCGPRCFIGKDLDGKLLIADDGCIIKKNPKYTGAPGSIEPKWLATENKNSIVKFNVDDNTFKFTPCDAKFSVEYKVTATGGTGGGGSSASSKPIGKNRYLLWTKQAKNGDMPESLAFWCVENFTESLSDDNLAIKREDDTSSYKYYKDYFGFDTNGDLYMSSLQNEKSSSLKKWYGYKYVLDGSNKVEQGNLYSTSPSNAQVGFYSNITYLTAIAYDSENELLYFPCKDGGKRQIFASDLKNDKIYELVSPDADGKITAMVAGDNHLFVAYQSNDAIYIRRYTYAYTGGSASLTTNPSDDELKINTASLDKSKCKINDMQIRGDKLFFTFTYETGVNATIQTVSNLGLTGRLYQVTSLNEVKFKNATCIKKWGDHNNSKAPTRFIGRKDGELAIANDGFNKNVSAVTDPNNDSVLIFKLNPDNSFDSFKEEKSVPSACTFSRTLAKDSDDRYYIWK